MVKNHMKRITAPKTWNVLRKTTTFITKPNPGAHRKEYALSINTLLKENLKLTKTTKETKYVLTNQEVLINGKRKRDYKAQAGFLDIISLPISQKHFIISVNKKGELKPKEISQEQADQRLLKIKNKTINKKGKIQLNTFNSMNILLDEKEAKKYKTGDSIIYSITKKKIIEHLPRKTGVQVFIFTGKHSAKTGTLEKIEHNNIIIKTQTETIETNKEYTIVVNKDKLSELE